MDRPSTIEAAPSLQPVILGPGPRLEILAELLNRQGVDVRGLGEVGLVRVPRGRLVLDGEPLSSEDARRLTQLLRERPGWRLLLIAKHLAPELEGLDSHPRVRILDWPLEADALDWIANGPMPSARPRVEPASEPSTPLPSSDPDELEAIDAILSGREVPSKGARRVTEELPALPDYCQDQVAELADIATCLELGLQGPSGVDKEDMRRDLDRLIRFTRTMGNLVRRPALDPRSTDLGDLVEQLLETRSGRATAEVLLRREGAAPVRIDAPLLQEGLESLLELGEACAEGQPLHIVISSGDSGSRFLLEMPMGPLVGTGVLDFARPYALRHVLPELGPSGLAAAASVVASHGGQLRFEAGSAGTCLAWFELPEPG